MAWPRSALRRRGRRQIARGRACLTRAPAFSQVTFSVCTVKSYNNARGGDVKQCNSTDTFRREPGAFMSIVEVLLEKGLIQPDHLAKAMDLRKTRGLRLDRALV